MSISNQKMYNLNTRTLAHSHTRTLAHSHTHTLVREQSRWNTLTSNSPSRNRNPKLTTSLTILKMTISKWPSQKWPCKMCMSRTDHDQNDHVKNDHVKHDINISKKTYLLNDHFQPENVQFEHSHTRTLAHSHIRILTHSYANNRAGTLSRPIHQAEMKIQTWPRPSQS